MSVVLAHSTPDERYATPTELLHIQRRETLVFQSLSCLGTRADNCTDNHADNRVSAHALNRARNWAGWLLVPVVAIVLLGACGTSGTSQAADDATPNDTDVTAREPAPSMAPPDAPAVAPETPQDPPRSTVVPDDPTAPPPDLVAAAKQALAGYLGVPPTALTLQSSTLVEWSDSSLGCPAPEQGYGQVVTTGYELLFAAADGQQYAVHTDATVPYQLVLCVDGQPTVLTATASTGNDNTGNTPRSTVVPTDPATVPPALVTAAQQALATQLGVPPTALTLQGSLPMEWQDGALGCPDPATSYMQVIVPGYELRFAGDDGQQYAVHTNAEMPYQLVLCAEGQPTVLAP